MKTSIPIKISILLVFSVILVGIFISVSLINISKEALYREIHEKQHGLSKRIGDRIWTFVKEKRLLLQSLANDTDFVDFDTTIMDSDIVRLMEQNSHYKTISVVDEFGKEIVKKKVDGDLIVNVGPVDRTSTLEFKISIRGRNYISPIFITKEEWPYLIISAPIMNINKEVAGIILAEVSLVDMWGVISEIRVGRSGYAFVVDNRGRLIAHPDKNLIMDPENILFTDMPLVRNAIAGKECVYPGPHLISDSETGTKVFGVQSQIEELGWGVIVQQPFEEIFQPFKQMVRQALIWSFISIMAILVIGYFVTRALTKPILDLSRMTKLVAKGDLTQRVKVNTRDEIGELATSFNKMLKDLQESNKAWFESEGKFKNTFDQAPIGIAHVALNGQFLKVNKHFCEILGYSEQEILKRTFQEVTFPDDLGTQRAVRQIILDGDTSSYTMEKRYIRNNGTIVWGNLTVSLVRKSSGETEYLISIIEDITERKKAEEELQRNFKKLEGEIVERKHAEEQVVASLKEKEVLIREIYHRTKNNMAVICSLLNLQSKHTKDKKVLEIFKETENRIKSMSLVHAKLYQSKDLSNINLKSYIDDLATNLFRAYKIGPNRISLKLNANDVFISIDTAIPCGLVINEIISNSLKYAFPDNKDGEIKIDIHSPDKEGTELRICDNGIGMPKDFNPKNMKTLGMQIIFSLIEGQLQGKVDINLKNGVEYLIKFKGPDYPKRV